MKTILLAIFFVALCSYANEQLLDAVSLGDADSVKTILESDPTVNVDYEDYGMTPLMTAIAGNYLQIAKMLLDAGADLNKAGMFEVTPLMIAAMNIERLEGLRFLIKNGADLERRNHSGETALFIAAMKDKSTELIKELVQAGANINALEQKGWSALMIAIDEEAFLSASELIALGADVNIKSDAAVTAIHLAARQWRGGETVKKLLAAGAEFDIATEWMTTPLHYACEYSQEAALALIEAGADINKKDGDERTPLIIATMHHQIEVLNKLIAKNADLNQIDDMGYTALMWASFGYHEKSIELVRILIAANADLNIQGAYGRTALDCANSKWGNEEIIKVLKDAGAQSGH